MLVEGEELPTVEGGQRTLKQDRQAWPVAYEVLVLQEMVWHPSSLELLDALANSQSIWLSEEVRHQLVVVVDDFSVKLDWCLGLGEANELSWDHSALVHQLVEAVLSVGAWLSEDDWTTIDAFIVANVVSSHGLTIALHVALLDVGSESDESLAVRQNCPGGMASDVSVVPADDSKEDSKVLSNIFLSGKIGVNVVHAIHELFHILVAIEQGQWEHADS